MTKPNECGVKALWRFYWDCGRQGSVEGLFVATDAEVDEAKGQHVYLGEVLGKHSDVHGTLDDGDLQRLTDDPDFIAKFEKFECESGYNPLQYINKEDES